MGVREPGAASCRDADAGADANAAPCRDAYADAAALGHGHASC